MTEAIWDHPRGGDCFFQGVVVEAAQNFTTSCRCACRQCRTDAARASQKPPISNTSHLIHCQRWGQATPWIRSCMCPPETTIIGSVHDEELLKLGQDSTAHVDPRP